MENSSGTKVKKHSAERMQLGSTKKEKYEGFFELMTFLCDSYKVLLRKSGFKE